MSRPAKYYLAQGLQRIAPLRWLLSVAVRLFAPKNYVGAVGAIFNDAGQVLLVEHVFRPDYVWGLPGGWVERGEDPALAVRREVEEELNLSIEVKKLLICRPQGVDGDGLTTPPGLGLAFYCRLRSAAGETAQASNAYEVLSLAWYNPRHIQHKLVPLQAEAIQLGLAEFEKEQNNDSTVAQQ